MLRRSDHGIIEKTVMRDSCCYRNMCEKLYVLLAGKRKRLLLLSGCSSHDLLRSDIMTSVVYLARRTLAPNKAVSSSLKDKKSGTIPEFQI